MCAPSPPSVGKVLRLFRSPSLSFKKSYFVKFCKAIVINMSKAKGWVGREDLVMIVVLYSCGYHCVFAEGVE